MKLVNCHFLSVSEERVMHRFLRFSSLAAMFTIATAAAANAQTPTFAKDVAPIFYRSCVNCHRPGQIAPMSLLTYDTARPWARSIKERVTRREMPPWHVDETVGIKDYKDDPSL